MEVRRRERAAGGGFRGERPGTQQVRRPRTNEKEDRHGRRARLGVWDAHVHLPGGVGVASDRRYSGAFNSVGRTRGRVERKGLDTEDRRGQGGTGEGGEREAELQSHRPSQPSVSEPR